MVGYREVEIGKLDDIQPMNVKGRSVTCGTRIMASCPKKTLTIIVSVYMQPDTNRANDSALSL